jgi:fermentation-respiration switch protein FrsA (DUF1100 family)
LKPKRSIKLRGIFIRLAVAYTLVLILITLFQRDLMYFPTHSGLSPNAVGLESTHAITFHSSDGTHLAAWHRAPQTGYPLIVYFHGNGGDLSHRADRLNAFAQAGFGFLILSYRGYGDSEGSPSEQGLYADADATIAYATQTLATPPERLILFGESLGTGVAVEMATRHDVGALLLEAPYISVATRAAEIYPWLPVRWLIRDHYDSLEKITRVTAPLLIFHGEDDSIIPIKHGRTLFAAANHPKQAHFIAGEGHSFLDASWLTQAIADFATAHRLVPPDENKK